MTEHDQFEPMMKYYKSKSKNGGIPFFGVLMLSIAFFAYVYIVLVYIIK